MNSHIIKVKLDVPDEIDAHTKAAAQHRAHEAAVLTLWQEGSLTIREAAQELKLSYRDFLDLLAAKGIPVERGDINLEAIKEAERKLAQ